MVQKYLETTHHTVNWFSAAELADELEIAPSFQRRPVWSDRQKSDLIGTILLGYPIPELYVHEVIGEDGDELHRLVDGQQRIRAVLEFLNDEFALEESDSVPNGVHQLTFEELRPADKRTVRSYKFVVRTLHDVDEVVVKEMFRRLNQGVVALNDQELRHATYQGPFLKLVEEIADRSVWSDFGIFSADDVRRMRDVETVSELAVAAMNGPQNKKQTLDVWYQTYEDDFGEKAAVEATFDAVLSQITAVVPAVKKTRWRKRSDFYSIFSAFARIQDQLPLGRAATSRVAAALKTFADQVDQAVRLSNAETLGTDADDASPADDATDVRSGGATTRGGLPESVIRYADAVERAATDLSRRRVREEVLISVIAGSIRPAGTSSSARTKAPNTAPAKKSPAKKTSPKKAPSKKAAVKKTHARKIAKKTA